MKKYKFSAKKWKISKQQQIEAIKKNQMEFFPIEIKILMDGLNKGTERTEGKNISELQDKTISYNTE